MNMTKAGRFGRLAGLVTLPLVIAAVAASADGDRRSQVGTDTAAEVTDDEDAAKEATVTLGTVTVGIDPKTGELRALSPTESARLAKEMSRLFKPRELKRQENADGSLSAVVAPNVLEYALVRIEPDGGLSRAYADSEEEALKFISDKSPVAAPAARE